jgi:hypothetical protein
MPTGPKTPSPRKRAIPISAANVVSITTDNFTRAESDTYFSNIAKQADGLARLFRRRELEPIDKQIVIRANHDTLYSALLFDLEAGPVTITLPDAGARFLSLIVVSAGQHSPAVVYGAGGHRNTNKVVCPHCSATIEPGEQIHVEGKKMICPWCGEGFEPNAKRGTQ